MIHHRHPPTVALLTCTTAFPFRDDTRRDVVLVAVSSPSMFPETHTRVAALPANAVAVVRSPVVVVPDTEEDLASNKGRPPCQILVLVYVP